ncbi:MULTISPECIES: hypothetical protein [unclassified Nocardioides]|uniref:hypothetical protein n=1 Tax=unclassified Nocardioides TaxID=2615069 RepID=UPI0006FFDC24|nr:MULTISPECIES: hypothetical protein [unclassified Nocardioides]KRA31398.1 hypothetical protein ASD81_18345 [Nocardioides sp. Root614]KRA88018.1 hypothetical protein ASD84_18620 [Nocardioides sp. Root682]
MARRLLVLLATLVAMCAGCSTSTEGDDRRPETDREGSSSPVAPERFTIAPDDYHVPYAGTAEDGRKFFLSDELFEFDSATESSAGYVGLFLWNADGSFSEIRVDRVSRADGVPPGQAASADADDLIEKRLAELGDYELEPITVEPFLRTIDHVEFGWAVSEFEGDYSINIEPGNFIAYYEPWDGLEYDT